MFSYGYKKIISTDISQFIVNQMNEILYNRIGLLYEVDDVLNMKYEQGSYDAIIDKAVMDSLLCKKDVDSDITKMMKEAYRVLSPQGTYIIVSHGHQKIRECYFDKSMWEWSVHIPSMVQLNEVSESEVAGKEKKAKASIKDGKTGEFYCYVLKKK